MKLTEKEIIRIYEVLDSSLNRIKDLLKVSGGSTDYYVYLINEQTETENLIKKFETKIAILDAQTRGKK